MKKRYWHTFERLRVILDESEQEWRDLLMMSKRDYTMFRNGKTTPTIAAASQIAKRTNLTLDHLLSGEIDFNQVSRLLAGQYDSIPERYRVGAFSRRRTSLAVLDYVEVVWSWEHKADILAKFQMHEKAFSDHENTINIRFLSDLCEEVTRRGATSKTLFNMGAHASKVNKSAMKKHLKDIKTTKKLFEFVLGSGLVSQFYDRNFDYTLESLKDDSCIISLKESDAVKDALKTNIIGNPEMCTFRSGTMYTLPAHVGSQATSVRKLSCRHQGDESCRYEISFGQTATSTRLSS
jgi:hypothetical protein